MPIPCAYLATSAKEIEKHFTKNTVASFSYTIMVQSLKDGAPTSCLCMFGTNHKSNFNHVLDRWEYTVEKLKERGIVVAGISSDGDTRLLKSMQLKANLGVNSSDINIDIPEFHANLMPRYICIQDTVHIGEILISRLLKPSLIIPLGNYVVSVGHLQMLIDNISKDKHQLTVSN